MGQRGIRLLNNAELFYKTDGIYFVYKRRKAVIHYVNPGEYPYFSLVLLSAQEEKLDRAKEIFDMYKDLPIIKETVVVGNVFQNTEQIKGIRNLKFATNKKINSPIITSVKYGLSCVSAFSKFAIITPVSKKQIKKEFLERFMKVVWKKQVDFAVPVINKERMHPIIIKYTEFDKIKRIRKEQGLKYFSKRSFKEVCLQ